MLYLAREQIELFLNEEGGQDKSLSCARVQYSRTDYWNKLIPESTTNLENK